MAGIEDEGWGLRTEEEALMFLDVGGIQTVIFAYFTVNKRKRDDLVIDR